MHRHCVPLCLLSLVFFCGFTVLFIVFLNLDKKVIIQEVECNSIALPVTNIIHECPSIPPNRECSDSEYVNKKYDTNSSVEPLTINLLAWTDGSDFGMYAIPWRGFDHHRRCKNRHQCDSIIIVNSCTTDDIICKLHYKPEYASQADAVIFNQRYIYEHEFPLIQKYRTPHQLWVLLSVESPTSDRKHTISVDRMKDNAVLHLFNLSSTYRRDSDIPFTYIPSNLDFLTNRGVQWDFSRQFSYPLPVSQKRKGAVFWLGGNCESSSNREGYIRELANYTRIDFYNSCYGTNNTYSYEELLHIMSTYKFNLVFENSRCHDWVSERLFRTLELGMIPIILGPPNIADYMPTDHSILNAWDYTPEKLAKKIKEIDENDTLYSQYVDFQTDPTLLSMKFKNIWKDDIFCGFERLCRIVAHYKRTGQLIRRRKAIYDDSCLPPFGS